MKKMVFSFILVSALLSCKSDTEVVSSVDKKESVEKSESHNDVVPNRLLTVELEGMVCEMGCGGSIRKALYETGGVESVEFDYEDDRELDVAKVKFDKDKVSVDEIIDVISNLNDHQFTIIRTNSEEYFSESPEEDVVEEASENEELTIKASTTVRVPNIFDLISNFLLF